MSSADNFGKQIRPDKKFDTAGITELFFKKDDFEKKNAAFLLNTADSES